jgi:hypothetical protein
MAMLRQLRFSTGPNLGLKRIENCCWKWGTNPSMEHNQFVNAGLTYKNRPSITVFSPALIVTAFAGLPFIVSDLSVSNLPPTLPIVLVKSLKRSVKISHASVNTT